MRNSHVTRFSTVQEIADMLRVSKMTVYRLIHSGELPFVRIGRGMRIPTASVWEYLHKQGISPHAIPKVDAAEPSLPSHDKGMNWVDVSDEFYVEDDEPHLRVVK